MSDSISGFEGFQIERDVRRPDDAKVAELRKHPVALVGDAIGRRSIMHSAIKPLRSDWRLAGSAVTVEVRPCDNLMIHAALAISRPGDVLVIDAKGDLSCGLYGGVLNVIAKKMGLAGVIIDGAVRDSLELMDGEVPVFTRGISPCGGDKQGPGQVNRQISCGGVHVIPGDVVLGDADGIVVVASNMIDAAIQKTTKRDAVERDWVKSIERGELPMSFVIPELKKAGVLSSDEDL